MIKDEAAYIRQRTAREIKTIQDTLARRRVLIVLLGKKLCGKTTYAQQVCEVLPELFALVSLGDMVRGYLRQIAERGERALEDELSPNLRERQDFPYSPRQIVEEIARTTQEHFMPNSILKFLLEKELRSKRPSVFLDGLPRTTEQLTMPEELKNEVLGKEALFLFLEIVAPEELLKDRAEGRRICPICKKDRNIKTNPTALVTYDRKQNEYQLHCDNPPCQKQKMEKRPGRDNEEGFLKRRWLLEEESIRRVERGYPDKFIRLETTLADPKDVPDAELGKEFTFRKTNHGVKCSAVRKTIQTQTGKLYTLNRLGAAIRIIKAVAPRLASQITSSQGV